VWCLADCVSEALGIPFDLVDAAAAAAVAAAVAAAAVAIAAKVGVIAVVAGAGVHFVGKIGTEGGRN